MFKIFQVLALVLFVFLLILPVPYVRILAREEPVQTHESNLLETISQTITQTWQDSVLPQWNKLVDWFKRAKEQIKQEIQTQSLKAGKTLWERFKELLP